MVDFEPILTPPWIWDADSDRDRTQRVTFERVDKDGHLRGVAEYVDPKAFTIQFNFGTNEESGVTLYQFNDIIASLEGDFEIAQRQYNSDQDTIGITIGSDGGFFLVAPEGDAISFVRCDLLVERGDAADRIPGDLLSRAGWWALVTDSGMERPEWLSIDGQTLKSKTNQSSSLVGFLYPGVTLNVVASLKRFNATSQRVVNGIDIPSGLDLYRL